MSMEHFQIDQEKDIKEMEEKHNISEFSRKRKLQYLASGITIVLIILAAVGQANVAALSSAYIWVLIIIAAGMLGFSFYNWRCPVCKKYMGRGYGIKNCPRCGVKLQK